MTTLVKALNKIENLFVQLGADKKDAEEAVELFSEVHEDKLATKEFVKAEAETLRKEIASAKASIIQWVAALLVAQAAAIVTLQNLIG